MATTRHSSWKPLFYVNLEKNEGEVEGRGLDKGSAGNPPPQHYGAQSSKFEPSVHIKSLAQQCTPSIPVPGGWSEDSQACGAAGLAELVSVESSERPGPSQTTR